MAFWSRSKKNKKLDVPPNAVKEASGLQHLLLEAGSGDLKPLPIDRVVVHYTGWNSSGEQVDSSHDKGKPSRFLLNSVIKGWTEGLQMMVAGEKRRLWIPADLAYGENPKKGRPAGDLVYDVELIDIERIAEPPPTPPNVKTIPYESEKSKSGLAWMPLKAGKGVIKPSAVSVVRVHYTGWRTNGVIFDSTIVSGEPAEFPLDQVIKGWSEGLQMMVEGEMRRFWIPASLAYGETPPPGAPSGMLVFDIELLEVVTG